MTSLTPANIPTEVLLVDLASIIRDPSWPVDPTLVASFRASIVRGEPPILDLSLNRMRLSDGSIGLEIIDGMHRLEALLQEGVTEHLAKVREYTTQDAFYARIATSIGKPNELLRQRAERALREGFVRDLAAHLEGAAFYQRGMAEDGNIIPLPRREPLPSDPLLALGTILWVHFAAKPEVTEDWERYIIAWLDDIATRLGKTPEWLRDEILDITALLGEELPGKRSAERVRLLLAIPDDGILRLVLARLKSESHLSTTDLRFALDMLGCGPDVSRHTWLKSRGLQEMRGILGHATLSQLTRDYGDALRKVERNKLLPRPEPLQTSPSVPSPQVDSPLDPPGQLPGRSVAPVESRPVDQSQVFGIVSPTFGGTQPKQLVKSVAPSPPIKGLVPKDYYAQAHDATDLLLRAWEVFDHLGGDWSRQDVQQDLLLLRALVEEYIQRGQAPRTN